MRKDDYLKKNGIKVRKVTKKERQCARTDYQRNADYIIACKGRKFYSTNGSLEDCKAVKKIVSIKSDNKRGVIHVRKTNKRK